MPNRKKKIKAEIMRSAKTEHKIMTTNQVHFLIGQLNNDKKIVSVKLKRHI